eukprot:CAMPEP_0184481892 /NCGR_PEP_ID=MMETSP0113_2-20130426/3472_1 /TAXON_ID=91329 /ORGANISM="Norrisiella sphaerica, Strain BC52" /LENGTH=486 /DNA_ID=CAMNT_0026861319 /DNA_START=304 /DNA_END=1764 /DNA_ORIENTATION=-
MFNRRETNISKTILKARQRDEQLMGLKAAVNDRRAYDRYIDFESKAEQLVQKTQLLEIANRLRKEDSQRLSNRRQRLAEVLRMDEVIFKREIDNSVESIDQRKQRMAARAHALREKRNKQREQKAQELYYQRFKKGCDELRTIDAEKHKKLILQERQKQLEWNRERRQRDQREEQKYAQMWNEDARRKEERHKQDMDRLNRLNTEQARNLEGQIRAKEDARLAEKKRIEREKMEIRAQAESDRKLAEERQNQLDAEKAKRNLQIKRYNQLREMQKQMQQQSELNDGEELNRINKEAMEKERQDAFNKKMRMKRENAQYLDHIRRLKEQEAEYQKELNKAIQEELDRGNRKRAEELQRREDARQKLMQEVDEDRRRNLSIKEERRMQSLRQKELDRQEMLRFEEEYKREKQSEGRDAYIRRKQIEADQLKLIAQKQQRSELQKAMAAHEKEYIDQSEKILQQYIEREKAKPQVEAPWHGLTKDNWYS